MYKYTLAIIVILLTLLNYSCEKSTDSFSKPKTDNDVNKSLVFDLDSLVKLEVLDTVFIKFDNVTKKENKRYRGVSTKLLFSKLVKNEKIDITNKEIIFLCKDGYSATVTFYQLLYDKGFIVNKDIDAELNWEADINSKFSPNYLVWDVDKNDNSHSFPYGIVQIKIVDKVGEFKDAYPTDAPPNVLKGFSLFKYNCMKCHAINKVGGTVAPELNIPMNVTQYWKNEHLEKFILNPQSYRYNSKMPTPSHLNSDDVKMIISYLKHMSENKMLEK